jgi:hypothetical protein
MNEYRLGGERERYFKWGKGGGERERYFKWGKGGREPCKLLPHSKLQNNNNKMKQKEAKIHWLFLII